MTLFESILQQYGTNEPILSSEVAFQGYSRPWIYKQLNRLCEDGKLVRYEKGVYYIPTQTPFGKSLLNPRKVIERKYISQRGDVVGYYSGMTFQNQLRLTTQMPNIIELYTNNEMTRVRDVFVGTQKVLLRRARIKITAENADVLSFLELMNDLASDVIDDEKKAIITRFISDRKITRKDISTYAPVFPDKAMRTLIESEVIYSVTQ
ncbi:MAG: DUF6088 family protein [Eubacteriales bacterium]|nr:DUF6088 family protein [Eubacteriales bacterium]